MSVMSEGISLHDEEPRTFFRGHVFGHDALIDGTLQMIHSWYEISY